MSNESTNQSSTPKRKVPVAFLVGGGLIVLAGLVIGGLILGGSDQPETENTVNENQVEQPTEGTAAGDDSAEPAGDETAGEQTGQAAESDSAEPAGDETAGEQATEGTAAGDDSAEPAGDETAGSRRDFEPGSLLFSLVTDFKVSTTASDATTPPEPTAYPDDPAAAKQMMIEALEAQGLDEAALAVFFGAFDALTDPDLADKLAALSEEEFVAATSSVEAAVAPGLEKLVVCLGPLLSVGLEIGSDPELQGDPALIEAAIAETEEAQTARICLTDALNELGRLIISSLEANDLL